MNININIDGVVRNTIQKFDYHYKDSYLDSEIEGENTFEYGVSDNINNDSLFDYYKFQSKEEYEYFLFMEYPLEIFGHAGLSYSTTMTDLHELMYKYKEHKFTLIGQDELGKAKPGTLFFLSKNAFLGDNIKFIKSSNIVDEWENCDIWITDNKLIVDSCPENKTVIKFNTPYNEFFTHNKSINKLNELTEEWSKFLENTTTLTLTQ